jgi:tRNA (cmo5U34)-methyltransferase
MLEKMGEFFDHRLGSYDAHQLNCIDSAREFLRFTAECLPAQAGSAILDLGCGTGLELESYLAVNPTAHITGIDLAPGMLNRLKEKFPGKNIDLVLGSYFDVPFGLRVYDAAVSVESLHHFTADEKIPLYKKLAEALKAGGFFILTDYFSLSDEEERRHRSEFLRLKAGQGIDDGAFYHYDTPLTVEHEIRCLKSAGFSSVNILKHWGATYSVKAEK